MCSPQAGFGLKYCQNLSTQGATSGEEVAVVTKNTELGFLVLFFVQGLSERVGFGNGGMNGAVWIMQDQAGSSKQTPSTYVST